MNYLQFSAAAGGEDFWVGLTNDKKKPSACIGPECLAATAGWYWEKTKTPLAMGHMGFYTDPVKMKLEKENCVMMKNDKSLLEGLECKDKLKGVVCQKNC